MLLRQINYFQAVVETGSFTKAAEQHYISQSAISQQIQALESELGLALLTRKNRRFELTEAGHYFYKKTLALQSDLDKICQETQLIAGKQAAHLSFGYLQSYDGDQIQETLAKFASLYPDVELSIKTGSHEDLYRGLLSGELDLVFNDQRRAFADGYHNLLLTESPTYVELSTLNPLAKTKNVEIEDLADVPTVLVSSQGQHDVEEAYYGDIIGFKGEFLFATSLQEARMMVAANRAVLAVEGDWQKQQPNPNIKRQALFKDGQPVKRPYCAFWKKGNSGYYVETMAQLLEQAF